MIGCPLDGTEIYCKKNTNAVMALSGGLSREYPAATELAVLMGSQVAFQACLRVILTRASYWLLFQGCTKLGNMIRCERWRVSLQKRDVFGGASLHLLLLYCSDLFTHFIEQHVCDKQRRQVADSSNGPESPMDSAFAGSIYSYRSK